ncbi:MAG: hypothetical protein WAO58_12115 [Fimbriimonadaceae bacterium]
MGPPQHTVFDFRVESFLSKKIPHEGPMLEIRQEQGDLEWTIEETRGRGVRVSGEPMLMVGSRYMLFLQWPPKDNLALRRRPHHEATFEGVTGKSGELGELLILGSVAGQVRIVNDVAVMPQEEGMERKADWRFKRDPQILGLSEAQLVAAVRAAIQQYEDEIRTVLSEGREAVAAQEALRYIVTPRPPEER